MEVTQEILADCRRRFAAGETDEVVIAHLRGRGASKVETIKVLVDLSRADPTEAKRLVHLSPTWKDTYERDERLHDIVEQVARGESSKN